LLLYRGRLSPSSGQRAQRHAALVERGRGAAGMGGEMTETRPPYAARKRSKYNNQPTKTDGMTFDSRAEARRYRQLQLLQAAGQISELVVHPVYELEEAFRRSDGSLVRAITYEGDFEYIEGGRVVVEDVKGVETDVFKLKRKLFWRRFPEHELRLVKA
jgi:hypothetical protein